MTNDPIADFPDARPAETVTEPTPVAARVLYAIYAVGFTSNALVLMLKVLVPLWAIQLGMSAGEIGLAIGASGAMPFLLAIHGGSLMDRLGTRRVALAFAGISTLLCGLYPMLPFVAALFLLQLMSGLTTSMGWVGAQALIVQSCRGNTALISRFSLAARVGTLLAPIMVGAMWDIAGAWGAFGFCFVWAFSLIAALLMVPATPGSAATQAPGERVRAADLLPRRSDYVQALAMLAVPAVVFVVAATYLRIASSAMQGSIYVVYLENIGLTGTLIGILIAVSEGGGLFGITVASAMERIMAPHWVLLLNIVLSLFFISITPFLGGIFALLLIASTIRGAAQGLSQPVMVAILSRAVSPRDQGRSIGLRATANRLSTMMVPVVMGYLVEFTSIEMSFVILGGVMIALCGLMGLVIRRIPGFST